MKITLFDLDISSVSNIKILLVHSNTNMCYMKSYINIYTNTNNRMSK
jgi:hypothetical protein